MKRELLLFCLAPIFFRHNHDGHLKNLEVPERYKKFLSGLTDSQV